jgi:hypothetical protein
LVFRLCFVWVESFVAGMHGLRESCV